MRLDMTELEKLSTGSCGKILIWTYEQVVHAQCRIRPGEWDARSSQGFWNTNLQTDHLISAWQVDLAIVKKKKKKKKEKKENLLKSRLCRLGRPQCENKRKRKER